MISATPVASAASEREKILSATSDGRATAFVRFAFLSVVVSFKMKIPSAACPWRDDRSIFFELSDWQAPRGVETDAASCLALSDVIRKSFLEYRRSEHLKFFLIVFAPP